VTQGVSDYAYWLWHNPMLSYPVALPGDRPLESLLTPDQRGHDFYEHNITIDPYSMQLRTPQQRLGMINQFIQGVAAPLAPLFAQQGMFPDAKKITEIYAKYTDTPEIAELFTQGDPIDAQTEGGSTNQPRASSTSHRVNERVNSGGQRGGAEQMIASLMAGGGAGGRN